jgi:uncharacterized coiled-coil protein SlyX
MSSREREGLIARIRQIRRVGEPTRSRTRSSPGGPDEQEFHELEHRVAHLEQLIQGLQDSVHRESKRQADRIADLEAQMRPAELAKSLTADARNRGL